MKKILSLSLVLLAACQLSAQRADYHVIPLPNSIQLAADEQCFVLTDGMAVAYDASNPEISRNVQFLCQYVEDLTGIKLQKAPTDKKAPIQVAIAAPAKAKKGKKAQTVEAAPEVDESYTIDVDKKGLRISAKQPVGLFRAFVTLRKSLPIQKTASVELPYVSIQDSPRFGYRGMMLDCARHYFPLETVKQYIDVMALHGCNQFHWHLTEDQGWRFEVKSLPRLAKEGSIRQRTVVGRNSGVYDNTPYGGYYTQEDCREIVNYAAERYINVIPEIDLPGHMLGALHVYPNLGCTGGPYEVSPEWGVFPDVLCAGNPEVITFLKTVLGELCDVFPSKYIHIGGDESPRDRWKVCPKCQAKIKELGLKQEGKHSPEMQLQSYINKEVEKFLLSRNRTLIGWDETLEGGLAESAIVMSWRGYSGGIEAARQHHNVIMTPTNNCYIDYYQVKETHNAPMAIGGYLPVSKVYSMEPVPAELTPEEQKYIMGPQCNLWTEYVTCPEQVFYMQIPRIDAISEVQWTQADKKDYENFLQRLDHMKQLYDTLGINYCTKVE